VADRSRWSDAAYVIAARLVTVGERYQEVGQLGVGAMLSNEPLHFGDERATRAVRR
jgi:hypothetical protein